MADRLNQMPDAELEAVLSDLGRRIEYPPTPLLAASVRARLVLRPGRPRSFWEAIPARRLALAAVVILAILLGSGIAFVPGIRDTIADWLGVRGIFVSHVPSALPSVSPLPSGPLGSTLGLGDRFSLADAQAKAGFTIKVPALPVLGQPDEVYFITPPEGGEVALVYGERPGMRRASETGVAVLVTEFRGDINPDFMGKMVGPGNKLEQVTVNEAPGFWIEGKPHVLIYKDRHGQYVDDRLRLAANTLVWEKNGVTYRIESVLSKGDALAIAQSMP
jgi:hypothetical protein